jgi:hypothetical protein
MIALLSALALDPVATSAGLEVESRQQARALERQQEYYRRKIQVQEDPSKIERQRLDRQLQRQRFQQRLLQRRVLQQRFPSRIPRHHVVTPSPSRSPRLDRAQRSQQLQFKIERESWRYPDETR